MSFEVDHPGIKIDAAQLQPAHVGDGVAAISVYSGQHYGGHAYMLDVTQHRIELVKGLQVQFPDRDYTARLARLEVERAFQQSRVDYWKPRHEGIQAAVAVWDNDEPIPPYTGQG